jgi:hypothetical protein
MLYDRSLRTTVHERAYAQKDAGVSWTNVDPLLRSLHGDARWKPFLRKIGFID